MLKAMLMFTGLLIVIIVAMISSSVLLMSIGVLILMVAAGMEIFQMLKEIKAWYARA